MAPLDMCGGGGGAGGGNDGSGGMTSFEHGRAAARHPSCEDASVAEKESQESPLAETAGERRKSRAAKLRQTRSRNAARIQQQVYTSAEDSEEEEEEEDVKPDLAMLEAEAQLGPGVDKQAWKKQQRMIRNRESAALSRKRKRDRIESLEEQVTRLVEENRGLKHRLAKYEASPQQARYKYARQSAPPHAHSAGPRETSSSSSTASGGRRNGSTKRGPAAGPPAGRNEGSGGAAAAFEGRNGGRGGSNCGKPMEVSSDCEGHGSNMSRVGAATAAVVDGGYSSSSASDDTPYTSEEEQQQQALSSDRVEFDKDDNAACDSLLRDILGQQDDSGEDDEFLSLLSDGDMNMMIVNPASEGLNDGLVKRELNNTSVVF